MQIEIIQADYLNPKHAADLAILLNAYACDPMGGSKPLSDAVLSKLAQELSQRPHAFSVLAYVNNEPAGLINCFELFSTFACKPLVNIHDIVVTKAFRGMGLSHKMLAYVETIARERGCVKLTLEVLSGNKVAKSSYNKFGFQNFELNPQIGSAMFWEKPLK